MAWSSWRPAQGEPSAAEAAAGDWRSQLQHETRQMIVNYIMDTLMLHLPVSVPEGLSELQKIAVRFEEKIYSTATSQSDYLRKISLKLVSMETTAEHTSPINPSMLNTTAQGEPSAADAAARNWRSQLPHEAQQWIVNEMTDTLARNLLIFEPEVSRELQKIAIRFEQKAYAAATSQSDYLEKISLKMLSMETTAQHTPSINPSMPNTNIGMIEHDASY